MREVVEMKIYKVKSYGQVGAADRTVRGRGEGREGSWCDVETLNTRDEIVAVD